MFTSFLLLPFIYLSSINQNIEKYNEIPAIEKQNPKDLTNLKKIILDKYSDEKKDDKIDFLTDSSINKFVNNKIHFTDIGYVPEDLENISWKYLIDSKWNSRLRKIANSNLENMSKDFLGDLGVKISIVSAYRSYTYQVWIKKWWCPDNLCAKAWYSEHQSWLAVDLWEASSVESWKASKKLQKYYSWLSQNAHKYWFTNTYQKWLEIDWYEIEPWHWRYVWVQIATYLKENNMTFAELYDKN